MATLKDIARECGVSAMTVSSVLNNKPGEFSPDTRTRVLEAARRLRYHPNAAARRLLGKNISTLGVADVTADATYWGSPYQTPVLEGILTAARRLRQDILYFSGHPSGEIESSLPIYRDGRCDGLLHFAAGLHEAGIEQIAASGLPIVLIGDSRAGSPVAHVDVDNAAAAAEATAHLLALGHRRIAMLTGEDTAPAMQRVAGFRQAHARAGLPVQEHFLLPGLAWEVSGEEQARALLSRPAAERPTALFCYNDALALGVLLAAAKMGVRVPEDLSVVGFDDIADAAASVPPLTTVRQPLRLIGERAVEMLLGLIRGERQAGDGDLLPHELIVRASTAPPAP